MGEIHGILPALLTPFDHQGKLNAAMIRTLVRYQLEGGVSGFFVNGGTGEGLLLDSDERKLALEMVLEEVNGRVPIIAHVGTIATHVATDLAAHAAAAGASAVAAIPPVYFRVDLTGLKEHYRQIAQAAKGLPVWLYHIPGATGVAITTDMLAELLEIDEIGGLKYTSYDFFTMRSMIEVAKDRPFTILSGPDEMCLPALTMGASGAIGTTYNMIPGHFVRLYERYQQGDLKAAQTMQYEANRVIKVFTSVPSLAALKEIMGRLGFDCGLPRRPLRPLSPAERAQLWQGLEETSFRDMLDIPWPD